MPEIAEVAAAIDITKALAIEGFMQPSELEWLAQQAQTHHRIAEVGSYYGRSTRALSDHAPGEVHAFDDFFGPRDLVMDYRRRMAVHSVFSKNLDDHLQSGRLIVHDEDHKTVEPQGPYDMIFIDGSHDYFDFKADLEKWYPQLGTFGLFCGHDYDVSYPGILEALNEMFGTERIQQVPKTAIWVIKNDAL